MVQTYTVFGARVGSHWLSIATLATAGIIGAWSQSGKKAEKPKGPPTNSTSQEEEQFIQEFMKNAEAEEKKASQKESAKQ